MHTLLSPVITITLIPAALHLWIESNTSLRGGSNIPTTPTNVKLTSYVKNLLESLRSICSGFIGLSAVARAKQRSVSRPVPYLRVRSRIRFLSADVKGT